MYKLTNAALDSVHFTGAGKKGLDSADGSKEVRSAALRTSSGISSRGSINNIDRKMRAASSCIVYVPMLLISPSLCYLYQMG